MGAWFDNQSPVAYDIGMANVKQLTRWGEYVKAHGFEYTLDWGTGLISIAIPMAKDGKECGRQWFDCYSFQDVRSALGY